MTYVTRELKAKALANLKSLFKGTNVKFTLGGLHDSTLSLTIKSSSFDFAGNFNQNAIDEHILNYREEFASVSTTHYSINEYRIDRHYSGDVREILNKIITALKTDEFFDKSDSQSDYYYRSHYININIGSWDKPYVLVSA